MILLFIYFDNGKFDALIRGQIDVALSKFIEYEYRTLSNGRFINIYILYYDEYMTLLNGKPCTPHQEGPSDPKWTKYPAAGLIILIVKADYKGVFI